MEAGFLIKITNRPESFNRSFVLIGNGSEPSLPPRSLVPLRCLGQQLASSLEHNSAVHQHRANLRPACTCWRVSVFSVACPGPFSNILSFLQTHFQRYSHSVGGTYSSRPRGDLRCYLPFTGTPKTLGSLVLSVEYPYIRPAYFLLQPYFQLCPFFSIRCSYPHPPCCIPFLKRSGQRMWTLSGTISKSHILPQYLYLLGSDGELASSLLPTSE
jgi:hypothetical protein